MKIIHIADLHLGKRLERFERLPEQMEVLDEIGKIIEDENPDVVLVAGDLFDTFNPPVEATNLLYNHLANYASAGKRAVIAIAGNHDSPDRIEVPDVFARELGVFFAGYPQSILPVSKTRSGVEIIKVEPGFVELKLPRCEFPLRVIVTPYANEMRLRQDLGLDDDAAALRETLQKHWQVLAEKYCDQNGVNILLSHLYFMREHGEPPEEPEGERSILIGGAQAIYSSNIPTQIQYVALGHLHRFQTIDSNPCPIVYSGSPLAYSFAEAGQKKCVVVIEAEAGKPVKYRPREIESGKSLVKKKFSSVSDAQMWLTQNLNCWVELSIETQNFISAEERKILQQAHPGIISIIPVLMNSNAEIKALESPNPSESMESLFIRYFKEKEGLEPGGELLALLKEVLNEEGADE